LLEKEVFLLGVTNKESNSVKMSSLQEIMLSPNLLSPNLTRIIKLKREGSPTLVQA